LYAGGRARTERIVAFGERQHYGLAGVIQQVICQMQDYEQYGAVPPLMGLRVLGERLMIIGVHGRHVACRARAMAPLRAGNALQRLTYATQLLTHERAALLALKELAR
jgi:hypothetical protein